MASKRKCRVCGCTEENACPLGCYWIRVNLCSACGKKMKLGTRKRGS